MSTSFRVKNKRDNSYNKNVFSDQFVNKNQLAPEINVASPLNQNLTNFEHSIIGSTKSKKFAPAKGDWSPTKHNSQYSMYNVANSLASNPIMSKSAAKARDIRTDNRQRTVLPAAVKGFM